MLGFFKKKKIIASESMRDEWFAEAKKQTPKTIDKFLKHLMNDYIHEYGSICHAIVAGSIATAYAMDRSDQGGITGFQAGFIMWGFIRQWNYSHNECGLKLMDYDNMCYPQYESKFEKTISPEIWTGIQKKCERMLSERTTACESVEKHWRDVVSGKVPFGYTVGKCD